MGSIYAGPGKVYRAADTTVVGAVTNNATARSFQAEGETGQIKIDFTEETADVANAMFGKIGEQVTNQMIEVSFKPFDNWGLLDQLFPPWLGVSVGAVSGNPQIGGRPMGPATAGAVGAAVATKVWTRDGRLYNIIRSGVTSHPALHLGIGKALYGDAKITGIGDMAVAMGASSFLIASNAATESAASDPDATSMTMADFVRERWLGNWNSVTGFTAVEAEDEWTIENQIKYSMLRIQGRVYAMQLDSVSFMAKCRPYGPTHTQIIGKVGAHTHGQLLGSSGDLVLTGQSTATLITLKAAEIKGAGFEFGGTQLGSGEIGFVNKMTFTSGVGNPLLVLSTYGNA